MYGASLLGGWGTRIDEVHPWTSPCGRRRSAVVQICSCKFVERRFSSGGRQPPNKKAPCMGLLYWVAGGPGFEPGLAESESAVLPLDDPPSVPGRASSLRAARPLSASRTGLRGAPFAGRPSFARPHVRRGSRIPLCEASDGRIHRTSSGRVSTRGEWRRPARSCRRR